MIKVQNKKDLTEIFVSGDIVDDSWKSWSWGDEVETYPEDIRNLLQDAKGEVKVYINSGGGDLFAGVAICNLLQRYEKKTTAVVDGLAGSAASIIAFGCDEIEIPSNAYLMIHKPAVGLYGNSDDLLKWADTLDELQKGILDTYMKHTKKDISEEVINNMIDKETWLTGKSASEYFNVKVTNSVSINNNVGNCVMNYTKTPDIFKNKKETLEDDNLKKMKKELELALYL